MANFKDIEINVIKFNASEERPVIYFTLNAKKELFEAKEVKTVVHASIEENETKVSYYYLADDKIHRADSIRFYQSELDFRSGKVYNGEKVSLYNFTAHNFNRVNSRYYQGVFSNDHYAFINGKAQLVEVKSYYTDGKSTWEDWPDTDTAYTYENTFCCIEDVYKCNPYTIVHPDGSEEFREPIMNRVKLTPEQKEALEKVKAAMEVAKELGVRFYYDLEDYDMYAFNGKEVKEVTWDHVEEKDQLFTLDLADLDKVRYKGFPRVTDINGDARIILNH